MDIGLYGRTNTGKILRFAWLVDSDNKIDTNKVILVEKNKVTGEFYYLKKYEEIIKSSKNIIDLIEDEEIVVLEYYVKKIRKKNI